MVSCLNTRPVYFYFDPTTSTVDRITVGTSYEGPQIEEDDETLWDEKTCLTTWFSIRTSFEELARCTQLATESEVDKGNNSNRLFTGPLFNSADDVSVNLTAKCPPCFIDEKRNIVVENGGKIRIDTSVQPGDNNHWAIQVMVGFVFAAREIELALPRGPKPVCMFPQSPPIRYAGDGTLTYLYPVDRQSCPFGNFSVHMEVSKLSKDKKGGRRVYQIIPHGEVA